MIDALLDEVESKISIDLVIERFLETLDNKRPIPKYTGCLKNEALRKYVSMKLYIRRCCKYYDGMSIRHSNHSGYSLRELEKKEEILRYEFYQAQCTCYTCPKQGVNYNGRRSNVQFDVSSGKWECTTRWDPINQCYLYRSPDGQWRNNYGDGPYCRSFS